jgi:PPOX class probable F420-dependent enzyme
MSSPEVATVPPAYRDLLSKKGFAHVATVGAEGEPQTQPMWYEWDGTSILLSHTKARQKFRNLTRDPRVAVCILDPDNPYHYLEIRGVVEIEERSRTEAHRSPVQEVKRQGSLPNHKPGDERVIIRIRPTRVNTYGD